MTQLIAGNWKMHGLAAQARTLIRAIADRAAESRGELLVCPPFTLVASVAGELAGSRVRVGAQDCHARPQGAHTGDISAAMLADAGAVAVILGHSERRVDHGETDAVVHAKLVAALAAKLMPIVCVGETASQRDAGEAEAVVRAQLAGSLCDDFQGVIAYEPVWAIGTGRVPKEEDVAAMHAAIRAVLAARFGAAGQAMRILYGGSVKPGNAKSLLGLPEVGGALIGGASLAADDFLAIAAAARAA